MDVSGDVSGNVGETGFYYTKPFPFRVVFPTNRICGSGGRGGAERPPKGLLVDGVGVA